MRTAPTAPRLHPAGTVALLTVIEAAQRLGFTLDDVVDARCDSLTDCTCADRPLPYLTIGTARPDGDPS